MTGYYLGCPGWGTKSWVGRLFPVGTRSTEFLALYARVFNAVEGNTTFYALPTADVVGRWRDQVPATFRFCFKFPREVTHDKLLVDCDREVTTFLERIAPLGGLLGTLCLQLPPRFDGTPELHDRLASFIDSLPREFHYGVELRHDVFFSGGDAERDMLALLRARGVDLVTMDSRGLQSSRSLAFADVRGRKPALPAPARTTASQPALRIVPHEDFAASAHLVEPWAAQVAAWIGDGLEPYVFLHAPDDTAAPENAYAFHAMLRVHRPDIPPLAAWPGGTRQLSLL